MSDQWGQSPQPGDYGRQPEQQPYYQPEQQPEPTQPMTGYYGQPQQGGGYPPQPPQQYPPAPAPGRSNKRPVLISTVVALAVVGGSVGIYFATKSGGSNDNTAQTASTSGLATGSAQPSSSSTPGAGSEPSASAANAQTSPAVAASLSPAAGDGSTDLLTTNQVCPSFLAAEQSLNTAMGTITDEATGAQVFDSYQPKFDALAAGTPSGRIQTQIQAVATDLDAIVAYIKANPHMSKPAPAAFDTLLNNFQNDADTVDNNCDPLGTATS